MAPAVVTAFGRARGMEPRALPHAESPWGLQQEALLREGLEADGRFNVQASTALDRVHKIDLVVLHRDAPHLPPVGIQFTTRYDPHKRARTVRSVRRDQVVSHLLYLEARCLICEEVLRLVGQLIGYTARRPLSGAVVSAVVWYDPLASVFRARAGNLATAKAA